MKLELAVGNLGRPGNFGTAFAMTVALAWCVSVDAQQINGTAGSPAATINIQGNQLPPHGAT